MSQLGRHKQHRKKADSAEISKIRKYGDKASSYNTRYCNGNVPPKHPIPISVTLMSNFSVTEEIILRNTSFHQVFNLGFIRHEGKCFSQQQMVMLWKILFLMILFSSFNNFFILFYFNLFIVYVFTHDVIISMMLWVIMFMGS